MKQIQSYPHDKLGWDNWIWHADRHQGAGAGQNRSPLVSLTSWAICSRGKARTCAVRMSAYWYPSIVQSRQKEQIKTEQQIGRSAGLLRTPHYDATAT